jgi:hypothetical protein
MSSSSSVAASLPLIHGGDSALPTKAQPLLAFPVHSSRFRVPAAVQASSPPLRILAAAAAGPSGERDNRVQELRVPGY